MADQDREQWGGGRPEGGGRAEGGRREGPPGRRPGGPGGDRDGGGFRIRLSDNELSAARVIQEAFQLRSTVAVLGFSLRTVAQLLEQGALDELVAQQKQAAGQPQRGERRESNPVRRGGEGGEPRQRAPRPDPFARPSKPVAAVEEVVEEAAAEEVVAEEVVAEEVAEEVVAVEEIAATADTPTAEE